MSVGVEKDGARITGRGAHTDIVVASAIAFLMPSIGWQFAPKASVQLHQYKNRPLVEFKILITLITVNYNNYDDLKLALDSLEHAN